MLNVGNYSIPGAELALKQGISRNWIGFAGLTLLNPSISNLPYVPKQALTIGLNGQIGAFRLSADAQYQSEVWALNQKRDTTQPTTEKVGAFTVVNARLGYPIRELGNKGEVFVSVDNLLNREYSFRPGYPMAGRTAQIGLVASF